MKIRPVRAELFRPVRAELFRPVRAELFRPVRAELFRPVRAELFHAGGRKDTFLFFRWRYSPLWALACRTIPLHLSLSITNSLLLLTPKT